MPTHAYLINGNAKETFDQMHNMHEGAAKNRGELHLRKTLAKSGHRTGACFRFTYFKFAEILPSAKSMERLHG